MISRKRWIVGSVAFLLPTLLMLLDSVAGRLEPPARLPGTLLYISLLIAAITCMALLLTARLRWWLRLVSVVGVLCLLIVQVVILGIWALMTEGLQGVQ
jgi:hypothetical protein